ncbi:hypothetical protein LR48_Vigan10g167100 [Vigna angularis]|uniref:Uncharacterized protein n=1 Tax=Phaseolus angularis TaxID=3914 RepID=A0A0L9VM07_PHAAN|nr:hypothetical protein LR48_Vigan10g167100 [Vigna angularis]
MESEKNSKSAKGEAASTAQRQFTAERHSGTPVGSAEGVHKFFINDQESAITALDTLKQQRNTAGTDVMATPLGTSHPKKYQLYSKTKKGKLNKGLNLFFLKS